MIRRTMTAAALSTLLIASLAGSVHAQSPPTTCSVPGQIERDGDWEFIRIPDFEFGPNEVVEYSVDPMEPDRLYLHNGASVMVSNDGGCTWATTFSLEAPPTGADYSADDAQIIDLSVAPGHALLAISQRDGLRPHVVISSYGGATWRRGDEGLRTVTGAPVHAAFTPSNPQYAYLLLEEQAGTNDAGVRIQDTVLESTTSGGSWTTRDDPPLIPETGLNTPLGRIGFTQRFTGVAADPLEAGKLFLFGPEGLYSFQAGAESRLLVREIHAATALPGRTSARTTLLAASPGRPRVQVSRDAGVTFSSLRTPATPDSFAAALDQGDFFASAEGRVLLRSRGRFADISPARGVSVARLTSARSQAQVSPSSSADIVTLYGLTDDSLVRYSRQRITDRPPPPPDTVTIGELPPLDLGKPIGPLPGTLLPQDTMVELREGESAAVAYELYLPPAPTPLDVMFDMDTSNSMLPAIDGLRAAMAAIVEELSKLGIDAWFGAAHYRSYSTSPAFERLQDIKPPGQGLEEALNKMQAEGGGDETQLESLYQIVTGQGSDIPGGIAPNQQANWRKGSLRIIVHMTDEPISEGGVHRPVETVGKTLMSDRAIHFGIAVQNEATAEALGPPLPGLIEISRQSQSLAPDQGVDCDGDDVPDLYDGEPLVCVIDHVRSRDAAVMGGAILSVLESVTDIGEVRLSARVAEVVSEAGASQESAENDSQDPIVQTSIPVVDGINFKTHNSIRFGVTFVCPSIDERQVYPIVIEGGREAGLLGQASATLVCNPLPDKPPPPAKQPPPVPPVAPVVIPPAALPLLAPAPPTVTPGHQPQPQPGPNVNPQPQPNPQSQAQPQMGMATQRQQQMQLAFAQSAKSPSLQTARAGELPDEEQYLMSNYQEHKRAAQVPYPLYLSVATSMGLAFAWLQIRQRRAQAALARRRRW